MRQRQKKIRQKPKFLAFEDSIIDERIYFQSIGNGEEIYYPWGKWGEAFYVSNKDKIDIKRIWFFTVIVYFIVFIIFKSYGYLLSFYLLPIFMNISFIMNVLILFIKCKNLKSYLHKNTPEDAPRIIKFARDHVALGLFQFIIAFIGIIYQQNDIMMWSIFIFTIAFYSSLLFLLISRNGFIFQKSPSA